MYADDDLLPISALQHLLFCERQCALIHIERVWADNRRTVEGQQLHETAHGGPDETRGGVRIVRGLPLRSLRLGLVGVADVVEFHPAGTSHHRPPPPAPAPAAPRHGPRCSTPAPAVSEHGPLRPDSAPVASRRGPPQSAAAPRAVARAAPPLNAALGTPYPVEYKRGQPKRDDCDRVQLCAQALCLEETLGVPVERGALFYGRTRRREEVAFDAALRAKTEAAAEKLHRLIAAGVTPTVPKQPKCRNCSLFDLCMPRATGARHDVGRYIRNALATADEDGSEDFP